MEEIHNKNSNSPKSCHDIIYGSTIRLRSKILDDARDDYNWHSDPALAQLDAVSPLHISFPQYLSEYIFELHWPSPTRKEFAVETREGKHIGNCVYYNTDNEKGEAEIGIMIGEREYQDRGYGTDTIATLLKYIFQETNLKRLYLKTLGGNTRAQKCFTKCGFRQYGRMVKDGYNFLLMETFRPQQEEPQ